MVFFVLQEPSGLGKVWELDAKRQNSGSILYYKKIVVCFGAGPGNYYFAATVCLSFARRGGVGCN